MFKKIKSFICAFLGHKNLRRLKGYCYQGGEYLIHHTCDRCGYVWIKSCVQVVPESIPDKKEECDANKTIDNIDETLQFPKK